jgi:hypothetical protein
MLNIDSNEFSSMICSPAMSAVEVSSAVTAQPKKSASKKAKKSKSIADTIREGIRAEMSNEAILKSVHKKHKSCNTTMACVYWYQSRFNRGLEK